MKMPTSAWTQWRNVAQEYGVTHNNFVYRIQQGWTPKEAASTPLRPSAAETEEAHIKRACFTELERMQNELLDFFGRTGARIYPSYAVAEQEREYARDRALLFRLEELEEHVTRMFAGKG